MVKPSPPRPEGRRPERAELAVAKRQKTMALQRALLEHGAEPAMILIVLALMGASSTVRIRRGSCDAFDDCTLAPEVVAIFDKYRPRFEGCLDRSLDPQCGLRLRYWEARCQVRALKVLCAMPSREMHELFTAFVASSLKSSAGRNPGLGDAPLAAALAPELNADVAGHCPIDQEFLDACGKPFLLQLASTLGLADDPALDLPPARLRRLKIADLRRALLDYVTAHPEQQASLPDPFGFDSDPQAAASAAKTSRG